MNQVNQLKANPRTLGCDVSSERDEDVQDLSDLWPHFIPTKV